MTNKVQFPSDQAPGNGAELRALGHAGEQALRVIQQAIARGDHAPVSPVEAVVLLDEAMEQLRGLLTAVPALLIAADPGAEVTKDIEARADELAALAEQVRATREQLDSFQAREREIRTRLAELSTLRDQVDELRRRERLAGALQELNEQREVIEERLVLLRQLTGHPENAVAAGAEELIRLADARLALLAPDIRDVLAQADETLRSLAAEEQRAAAEQSRLSDAQERLAVAQQRQAQLVTERDSRLAQLAAHARTDSALVTALSADGPVATSDPVERLRTVLDGITVQLDQVDGILRDTITSNQAGYDRVHAKLGWTGQ